DEVIVYQSMSGYLGVLQWKGTQLQVLWGKQFIPSLDLAPAACQFFIADVDGDNSDEILLYDPASKSLGLLKWQGSALANIWLVQGLVPGGLYLQEWDQFFVANLDASSGDKSQEIIVFSSQDRYLVALKWDSANQQLQTWGNAAHNS